MPKRIFYSHLTVDGSLTDTVAEPADFALNKNFSDGGLGVTDYFIQPPAANMTLVLVRMFPYIRDGSGMAAEDFGNITDGLTNGLKFFMNQDGATEVDMTAGDPIKNNAGLRRHFYDAARSTWSTGDEFMSGRWTFTRDGNGDPIVLRGSNLAAGCRMGVRLHDDLSDLTEFNVKIRGELIW